MDEQMMRERFEAAWDSWGWAASPADFWDAERGSYVDGAIQWAWQGFRAALSQPAAQGDSSHPAGGECGGVQFSIRGVNSGFEYGTVSNEQELEVWFANHPDASEVTRIEGSDGKTIVAIEREA